MRTLITTLLLISLIACKGQSNEDAIYLTADKYKISIENINCTENSSNPLQDYKINVFNDKIDIEPSYLESDNLDGKLVNIVKGNFNQAKIKYEYDGIFYGADKLKITIGEKRDTVITVPINNNSFKIPEFTAKNYNNKMLEKAYVLNKAYYNDILSNADQYGGMKSAEYKNALAFLNKKQAEFKNLEQLSTEVNYTKLDIELINTKSNLKGEIIYKKKINDEFSFKTKENTKKENFNFSKSDIDNSWSVNCDNGLTEFDITGNKAYLSLYSDNAIYINARVEQNVKSENEYLIYFDSTGSQEKYYADKKNIVDEEISKTEIIGKISLNNKDELILKWIGLYNLKTKSLEFVSDFVMIKENGGANPIILKKCK